MGYTLSGGNAAYVTVYVATNDNLPDHLFAEYLEGQENQPVLVFEDAGNQVALIIEGSLADMETLLSRAAEAVRRRIEGG